MIDESLAEKLDGVEMAMGGPDEDPRAMDVLRMLEAAGDSKPPPHRPTPERRRTESPLADAWPARVEIGRATIDVQEPTVSDWRRALPRVQAAFDAVKSVDARANPLTALLIPLSTMEGPRLLADAIPHLCGALDALLSQPEGWTADRATLAQVAAACRVYGRALAAEGLMDSVRGLSGTIRGGG